VRAPVASQVVLLLVAVALPLLVVIAAIDVSRGGPIVRAAGARIGVSLLTQPPSVVVRAGEAPVIEVQSGIASPADLKDAAGQHGHPDLVARDSDAWDVAAEVRVLRGAVLEVHGTTVRLAGALEGRGGHVDVQNSRIVGWSTTNDAVDREPADGRAWLAAVDGGRLTIGASTLRHLGHDEPGREGVAWVGLDARGSVSGSTIEGVHDVALREVDDVALWDTVIVGALRDGISQIGGGPLVYESVTVREAGRDGVRLAEASGGELVGVRVAGTTGAGIAVTDDSVGVAVSSGEITGAGGSGVRIHDAQGVTLRDSDIYHNAIGVLVEGAASRVELTGNRIAGNDEEGLFVRNGSQSVVVRDNRIDRNGLAGLALVGVDVSATSNVLAHNADGVRIGDPRSTGVLADNRVTENVEDGIDLPERATLDIDGNLIADNRHGAFSVLGSGRSDAVVDGNELRGNGDGQERIRER
jgi:hypothetical protein